MKRKLIGLAAFGAAAVFSVVCYERAMWATPANSGYTSTTLAKGTFEEIDVFNKSLIQTNGKDERWPKLWLSLQKTKGSSDLYVQTNVWQSGGSTGWHTHPGHSLIIVTSGTLTEYEGGDRRCKPHVYTQGMTFVDPGGDHVHILKNEGNVEASTIAVQLIPAGAARRIDAEDPGNCPF